jgi:peptide/nickel transport system substrate-binding protein
VSADREGIIVLQPGARLSDPHICSDAKDRLSVLAAIYEPLVHRVAGGGHIAALATTWSVTDDARSWTFELRQGVTFHNGDTLEAEDVVASLARVCDPVMGGELGTQGVYRSYLGGATVEALGRERVRIDTPEPLADLLDILAELPVVPRRALGRLPGEPAGSGPYRVVNTGEGRVELEPHAAYWGGSPQAGRLVFQAETDSAARLAAVLAGAADIAAQVDAASRQRVQSSDVAQILSQPGSTCVILICGALAGACADVRVRQALNHAVDVPALIDALHPDAADANNGPLTPLHLGYDPETPPYRRDSRRARELLAEAGYSHGLALTLDTPTIWPDESLALAELLRGQFGEVGVTLTVRAHADRPAYAEMVRAKQIGDLCVFDSSPLSTFRVLREKLHSGVRGPWWEGYASHEVDRLIDTAQATPNPAKRQAIYRHVYRRIRDDAPWVFLYTPRLFWAVGPRLQAWRPGADGVIRVA